MINTSQINWWHVLNLEWTWSKSELDQFLKDLNKKHPSIKFDYKVSQIGIAFLDTLKYIYIQTNYTQKYVEKTLIGSTSFKWNLIT